MEENEYISLSIKYLTETWNELVKCLLKNPDKLVNHQMSYWHDYLNLYQNLILPPEDNADKRFKYQEWQDNLAFDFIKRSYLLISKHLEDTIIDITKDEDIETSKKLRFIMRQFIDASAPTNIANLNPEILSKIAETNGENILLGYKNFLENIQQGRGLFNIKLTDMTSFEIGRNIACTPGKIIFQNDLIQLIQYQAATEKTYQYPLLIIPPWINKYYILDLQKENSLVRWLVSQGFTVFMISWINPSSKQRTKQFSDYMQEGPLAALKIIEEITNEPKTNVLGYCIGGTLLAYTLAYLAQTNDTRINAATFLTTLLDFSEPGELAVFTDAKQITIMEKIMASKGYFDGNIMAAIFNSLRANDLVWSSFVKQYLKGENPQAFDLLYWNSDATNIPEYVHSFYLRNMYLENNLVQPGKLKLDEIPIDLGKITIPTYFIATQDDHIVPWASSFKSQQYFNGPKKFVLATSGHVAGIVNPPSRNKYGYWYSNKKVKDPEKYLANAKFQEGSWWNDWKIWVKKYSGKRQSVNTLNLKNRIIIEDAPGSYAKVSLADIALEEAQETKSKDDHN
ncbi:MAG: class I poly(R)-hydroxyalkanoic acid synthase [Gammaproteobacteria bacterium]|nr:class I poly(R)-hydroxyalkanoic acid synthase [Gammaproteobacteria bacterium]